MKEKNNLKKARFFKEITQNELSVIVGYDQSLISSLERGTMRNTPRTEKLKKKVAKALGSTVEEIFPSV